MHNTILASIEFYFRGERHTPWAVINLDACMKHEEPMQQIYHILAAENGIGHYSHEFDVMIMEEISFSEPSGLAVDFFAEGTLDTGGLREAWQQEKTNSTLQSIALKHLGIENLDEHPTLKAALIEAFQAD